MWPPHIHNCSCLKKEQTKTFEISKKGSLSKNSEQHAYCKPWFFYTNNLEKLPNYSPCTQGKWRKYRDQRRAKDQEVVFLRANQFLEKAKNHCHEALPWFEVSNLPSSSLTHLKGPLARNPTPITLDDRADSSMHKDSSFFIILRDPEISY